METKTRYTPETIRVRPIDKAKLDKNINDFMQSKTGKANIAYRTSGYNAIIREPKLCIIDDEFIGHDISDKVTWYVYETETMPDGRKIGNCLPTHEVTITLPEMEQFLQTETTLAEFTKERRGYNSRIRQNEADWMRFFNKA